MLPIFKTFLSVDPDESYALNSLTFYLVSFKKQVLFSTASVFCVQMYFDFICKGMLN